MKIKFKGTKIALDELTINELIRLRKQLSTDDHGLSVRQATKAKNFISNRILDLQEIGGVKITETYRFQPQRLEVEVIPGVQDYVGFIPGGELTVARPKGGKKFVVKSRALSDNQGWAIGGFYLTVGRILVVTGKISRSRNLWKGGPAIMVDGRHGLAVSFDEGSADAIDMASTMNSCDEEFDSRSPENGLYGTVLRAFLEAYPELLDSKGDWSFRRDDIKPSFNPILKEGFYPFGRSEGRKRAEQARKRAQQRAQEKAEREQIAEVENDEALEEMGLEHLG